MGLPLSFSRSAKRTTRGLLQMAVFITKTFRLQSSDESAILGPACPLSSRRSAKRTAGCQSPCHAPPSSNRRLHATDFSHRVRLGGMCTARGVDVHGGEHE